jgi:two-component system, sensor histidine kinase
VRRVLANLVANAIRYTAHGSVQVGVHVDAPARCLQVWVQDSGIGIAPEELPRVFEEFYQVGNPARDRRQGMGLGLATVRRLSDALGLGVRVESELGRGSRFQFELPLAEPGRLAPTADKHVDAGHDHFRGRRVLVIEDDLDSADALRRLLTGWGCEVQLAANGQQARACVDRGFTPVFVLADLRLADGENGAHVCRQLGLPVPTLIVTGDAGSEAAHTAQTAHSADAPHADTAPGYTVLSKPVNAMRLRAYMNEAFSRSAPRPLTPPAPSVAPPPPADRTAAPPVSA